MSLSQRLEEALSFLALAAREGVVEGSTAELATVLRCRERTVRSLVLRLERAGSVTRENDRGERLRLVVRTATTQRVERQERQGERQERQAEGGRGVADLAVLFGTKETEAAAAAAFEEERQERQAERQERHENGKLRLVIEGDPSLLAEFMARLGALATQDVSPGNGAAAHLDLKPENILAGSPEELAAVEERFAQLRDEGERIRSPQVLEQLVLADCRRSSAVLSGLLRSAEDRRTRALVAKAERENGARVAAAAERERLEAFETSRREAAALKVKKA